MPMYWNQLAGFEMELKEALNALEYIMVNLNFNQERNNTSGIEKMGVSLDSYIVTIRIGKKRSSL